MTNAQSKLLTPVYCTCKDFHHPWTDKCVNASAGMLLAATPYCLRVYTMVYTLSLLMRHRIPTKDDIKNTIWGILQSSAFLITNAYTFMVYNCLVRYLLGHYNIFTAAFVPTILASWTALSVERPTRRPLLALYVANVASETLWNMAESRGLVRSLPHGQTIIFGIGVSILLYLFRLGLHKTTSKDALFNILQIFVGKEEAGPIKNPIDVKNNANRNQNDNTNRQSTRISITNISSLVQIYGRFIDAIKSKHSSCPHKGICLKYAILGGLKPFLGGITLQVVIKLLMNFKKVIQFKMNWRKTIFNAKTCKLAIFLGSFSFLYKAVSCSLRHSFGYDSANFAIPAGLVASIAFTQYPDNTVALYIMWKMLQIVYNLGIKNRLVPNVPYFVFALYSVCTAVLFHAALVEPRNLRPSYYKFLQSISGERLTKFHFTSLDAFGLNTSEQAKEVQKTLNIVERGLLPKCPFAF